MEELIEQNKMDFEKKTEEDTIRLNIVAANILQMKKKNKELKKKVKLLEKQLKYKQHWNMIKSIEKSIAKTGGDVLEDSFCRPVTTCNLANVTNVRCKVENKKMIQI